MKQKLLLNMPKPCDEDWNNMTGTQQGRFCMSCQKEVIDFSVMSDKEILAHISKASGSLCGRVAGDQLNRDLIMPREPQKIGWRYWVSIAASFILLSSKSGAQVGKLAAKPVLCKPATAKREKLIVTRLEGKIDLETHDNTMHIHGRIVDDYKNPVPFASVRIKESNLGASADSVGNFILKTSSDMSDIELSVSSVGYETKIIQANTGGNEKSVLTTNGIIKINMGDVLLKMPALDTVSVTGYKNRSIDFIAGGIAFCRRPTRIEKAKMKFKEVFGVNEIKVYPNPIAANTIFNIRFNVKDAGEYNVQFTDVSGKIIAARQLRIAEKNQLESFNGNMFKTSGVYFVSLINKHSSKIYTTKLLVQ